MAYEELSNRFTKRMRTHRSQFSQSGDGPAKFDITDANVEKIIDEAGRDAVFARARELGWGVEETPPRWVWVQISYELIQHQKNQDSQRTSIGFGASLQKTH